MKYNKKDIQTWIDALRSGKYKQGYKELQSGNDFCCLGVACKIFIPKKKQQFSSFSLMNNNPKLLGDIPADQENSPEWLKTINQDFYLKTISYLHHLNDRDDYNFDEIADLLQMVYIEKVLD